MGTKESVADVWSLLLHSLSVLVVADAGFWWWMRRIALWRKATSLRFSCCWWIVFIRHLNRRQLHRVFSRIRDHETAAEKGPCAKPAPMDYDGEVADGDENVEEEFAFPPMPSEEDILRAQGVEELAEPCSYRPRRQTLLYSATAIQTLQQRDSNKQTKQQGKKALKLRGTLCGVASHSSLPSHLKQ